MEKSEALLRLARLLRISANVGGITRLKTKSTGDVSTPAKNNQAAPRGGGITRMKK